MELPILLRWFLYELRQQLCELFMLFTLVWFASVDGIMYELFFYSNMIAAQCILVQTKPCVFQAAD